ncbi:hypothetical protein OZX73_07605 [Bifidobacterium sp. ESL0775]|uniref:hypothetical protein n=1 Tax=Bifidobacterium sp. ESL0775 TaxID=2983230 RepID=UPI0023F651AC|nr:hypothetical protein [Bifidobacterium sp. ESL0775]WEV69114.1 hypothetical protein OZX73_07605 [Bifidobacterium sp. ESL0775]
MIYKKSSDFLMLFLWVVLSILFIVNEYSLTTVSDKGVFFAVLGIGIIVFILIAVNKASLISLLIICLNVLLVPILIQYYTGHSYGILSISHVTLHISEVINNLYLYDSVLLILSFVFNFSGHEKVLWNSSFLEDEQFTIWIRNFIALIFAIVAFPRGFGQVSADERFDMLLPGKAWNQLSVVALLFNLPYLKKSHSVRLTYLLVIFWFLSHGERADIAGIFAGLIFYWLATQKKGIFNNGILKKFVILLFGFVLVALLGCVGYIRIYHVIPDIRELLLNLLTTATISDVAYLFNVSIDYGLSIGHTNGQILITNILSAIPFFKQKTGFTDIINGLYPNPGGEPLLAEPIMDFGMVSLPIIGVLDFFFFFIFLRSGNKFFKYEFLVLLCSIPRIVWYGRSYVFSSVLFFVPFIYCLSLLLNKHKKKISEKNGELLLNSSSKTI